MAALTANRPIPNIVQSDALGGGIVLDLPLGATEQMYQGGFVSLDAGDKFGAPLAAGEIFVGISLDKILSVATNGTNTCRVLTNAMFQHAITSIAQADIGKLVYASDDNTLTLTSTSNSQVGRIVNVPATGTAIVQMKIVGEAQTQAATA